MELGLLQQQISTIITDVMNSHQVGSGRQIPDSWVEDLGKPHIVWGHYMTHTSHGSAIQTFPCGCAWVSYGGTATAFTQARATVAAQQAVSRGTTDELNFLRVPTLQATLAAWEKSLSG